MRDKNDLRQISQTTLAHYESNADSFWEGTRDHDVTQNYEALLRHITAAPPFSILDLGCGPGRDLRWFRDQGHAPVGLDGCEAFVKMAREYSGCEVLHQDFLLLDLPAERFDGVFANASLFHVPSAELPRVLRELAAALRPNGVLFCSNPRGDNEEGWNGSRYGSYLDLERFSLLCREAGFVLLEHYFRPPGRPRHQQPWLATVWRRA
jgi:SAM-dependent methyltransferase